MSAISTTPGRPETDASTLDRVVHCLADGRFEELQALLMPGIRLRALIPPGPEEHEGSAAVVLRLRDWFDDGEQVRVESLVVEPVADRWLLAYRFTVGEGASRRLIAQQCICDVEDGRLSAIDLVCSGFRAEPTHTDSAVCRFDAGDLSCADGLAQEFRRRITSIPIGAILEVVTSDPAAREDLPPLARMMGNTVHSAGPLGDGQVLIAVERNR